MRRAGGIQGAPRVILPTLHPDQMQAFLLPGRFKAIRCGRRWGKTDFAKTVAADFALKGANVGWFAPDYKISIEAYNELELTLAPVLVSSSRQTGVMRTITNGRMDMWTLENERAGRSRKYHLVIIDEAAFAKANLMDIWEKSIKPTLLDFRGSALVLSNTNGVDPNNFFYKICTDSKYGFVEYHAPTHRNPYLPQEELDKLILDNHPLVYKQEYLAEFVDWSGDAFFNLSTMLVDGQAVDYPTSCDAVFATIDTAVKTGKEHDGTAIVYWAINKQLPHKLVILDYDIIQIEGALLENWLPTAFKRLEGFARACNARMGSLGAWIEDKSSGMVLLQQAQRRQWPARAIDSVLTSLGKSERAISISGYVHRNLVKISKEAYNRVVVYKGTSRNHLLGQVIGFRVGVKDQIDDDLLDTFCYGVAIALGNAEGF